MSSRHYLSEFVRENKDYIAKIRQEYPQLWTIRATPSKRIYVAHCVGLYTSPDIASNFTPQESNDVWTFQVESILTNQLKDYHFEKLDKPPTGIPY